MATNVVLFDADAIARRIDQLAQQMPHVYSRASESSALLKCSFAFVGDLVRALRRHGTAPQVEFMRPSSYGLGTASAGEERLLSDAPGDIAERAVTFVYDIVDTGHSLTYTRALLEQRDVAHIFCCALIDKPSCRKIDVTLDFMGFAIGDVFIADYGIDYAERYREFSVIVAAGYADQPRIDSHQRQ